MKRLSSEDGSKRKWKEREEKREEGREIEGFLNLYRSPSATSLLAAIYLSHVDSWANPRSGVMNNNTSHNGDRDLKKKSILMDWRVSTR